MLAISLEVIATAHILNPLIPTVDTWAFASLAIQLLTYSNFFSVARHGEFEFWFGLLKISAVITFIGLCPAALLGILPNRQVSGLEKVLAEHNGFAPNGATAIVGAILTTMFSFVGADVVTIAAAESSHPVRQISSATNSVVCRIERR